MFLFGGGVMCWLNVVFCDLSWNSGWRFQWCGHLCLWSCLCMSRPVSQILSRTCSSFHLIMSHPVQHVEIRLESMISVKWRNDSSVLYWVVIISVCPVWLCSFEVDQKTLHVLTEGLNKKTTTGSRSSSWTISVCNQELPIRLLYFTQEISNSAIKNCTIKNHC